MPSKMKNKAFPKGDLIMEKKKEQDFIRSVDFKEQTPEVCLENKPMDPLYEAAFLNLNEKNDCEYARNTTTWD